MSKKDGNREISLIPQGEFTSGDVLERVVVEVMMMSMFYFYIVGCGVYLI